MEATKKKKAYIKPRMEKFEMKMETAFLTGSKGEVIITPEKPDVTWMTGYLSPQCTKDGVAKKLQTNEYTCFRANQLDITTCKLFNMLGANVGDWIKVTRINNNEFRAEIIPEQCSGGVVELPDEEIETMY